MKFIVLFQLIDWLQVFGGLTLTLSVWTLLRPLRSTPQQASKPKAKPVIVIEEKGEPDWARRLKKEVVVSVQPKSQKRRKSNPT